MQLLYLSQMKFGAFPNGGQVAQISTYGLVVNTYRCRGQRAPQSTPMASRDNFN
jgi:hypothetical protein